MAGYSLDKRGSIPDSGRHTPVFRQASVPAQATKQLAPGALTQGTKRPQRGTNRSSSSSGDIKIRGSIPPLLHTTSRLTALLRTRITFVRHFKNFTQCRLTKMSKKLSQSC